MDIAIQLTLSIKPNLSFIMILWESDHLHCRWKYWLLESFDILLGSPVMNCKSKPRTLPPTSVPITILLCHLIYKGVIFALDLHWKLINNLNTTLQKFMWTFKCSPIGILVVFYPVCRPVGIVWTFYQYWFFQFINSEHLNLPFELWKWEM